MAEIREKLVLEDRFSGTLNQFSNQMSAAARMAGAGHTAMTAAAERQARTVQVAASAVAQSQYDANAAIASTGQYFANTGQQAALYAQRIVQNEAQLRQLNVTLQLESQRLAEIASAQGAASAAARQQNDTVRRLMGTIQGAEYKNLQLKTAMDKVAGSTRTADRTLEGYRRSAEGAGVASDGLLGRLKGLVGGLALARGVQSLFGMSDAVTQTKARLEMMNDGLQTTERLNQMIYQSAQRSRGAYAGTADMVAKLGVLAGNAFASSAEVVAFAEQINKHFTISGTAAAGQQAAMLQLTQAMSSGILRGEELNSIMEQVPTVAAAIAQALGVSTGEMRELAAEGRISAQVVKAAMFAAADETNAKFATMPMTWNQVWTGMQNTAVMALQPVLTGINWLANNIEIIGPLVLGIGTAFLVFLVAANWINIVTGATNLWTGAQKMLNVVMAGNPIFLVLIAVAALIGLFYAGVAAYNKFTGASVSATGIISGAFFTAGAFIGNVLLGIAEIAGGVLEFLYNGFAGFANFFGNLFNDPVGAVIHLFGDMGDNVLGIIEKIASAIDFVFGSNLAGTVSGWRSSLADMTESAANRYGNGSYHRLVERLDVNEVLAGLGVSMERFNYGDAYQAGYDWGSNLSLGDVFGSDAGAALPDYSALLSGIDGIVDNTGQIARNTAVDPSDEDLKYLEDVAIRRYEARVNTTQLAPNITVQVSGKADKSMGLDIANTLKVMLAEQLASHTTATYAEV